MVTETKQEDRNMTTITTKKGSQIEVKQAWINGNHRLALEIVRPNGQTMTVEENDGFRLLDMGRTVAFRLADDSDLDKLRAMADADKVEYRKQRARQLAENTARDTEYAERSFQNRLTREQYEAETARLRTEHPQYAECYPTRADADLNPPAPDYAGDIHTRRYAAYEMECARAGRKTEGALRAEVEASRPPVATPQPVAPAPTGRTQLWEPCEECGAEPSYPAGGRHLCARCGSRR